MLSRELLLVAPDPAWARRVAGVQEPQSSEVSRGSWLNAVLKLN